MHLGERKLGKRVTIVQMILSKAGHIEAQHANVAMGEYMQAG